MLLSTTPQYSWESFLSYCLLASDGSTVRFVTSTDLGMVIGIVCLEFIVAVSVFMVGGPVDTFSGGVTANNRI